MKYDFATSTKGSLSGVVVVIVNENDMDFAINVVDTYPGRDLFVDNRVVQCSLTCKNIIVCLIYFIDFKAKNSLQNSYHTFKNAHTQDKSKISF